VVLSVPEALQALPRPPWLMPVLRIAACVPPFLVVAVMGPPFDSWGNCSVPPMRWGPQIPQLAVAGICAGAFLLGHVLANLVSPPAPSRTDMASRTASSRKPNGQDVVVLVLVAFVIGLVAFECVAVLLDSPKLYAISFYVRCGNWIANYLTTAIAGTTTFVLGSWLRYPWWSV